MGAVAAIGLAASPAFLFMLMQPMSDIPAAAFWTAAFLFTLGSKKYSAMAAGVCCAAAIVIRPNLAPLAAIPFGYLLWTRGGWLTFALAVAPGAALVAAVNAHSYGSPLMSGWRRRPVCMAQRADQSASRGGWLLERNADRDHGARRIALDSAAEIPTVRAVHQRLRGMLFYSRSRLGGISVSLPMFHFFDSDGDWSDCADGKNPRLLRADWTIVPALVVGYQIDYAVSRGVCAARVNERRAESWQLRRGVSLANAIDAQHAARWKPPLRASHDARYDRIAPSRSTDDALLQDKGYRPFIVLDEWEVPVFRRRFAASEAGQLQWDPMADFSTVRVYEPPAR